MKSNESLSNGREGVDTPCHTTLALSSERSVKLVVREVRHNSRREIRLQVLVKKLLAVRLGLPDLDQALRIPPAGLGPPVWDMKPFAERSNGIRCSSIET
jgi:hypothetical protein